VPGRLRECYGGSVACSRCARRVEGERSRRGDSTAPARAWSKYLPLTTLLEPLTRWARQGSGRCRPLHSHQ
jgi:hypothetical protein